MEALELACWNAGPVTVHGDTLRALLARLRAAEAERDALRRHYDAAAPEHNLLALLDLYEERESKAVRERDAALAEVARLGDWEKLAAQLRVQESRIMGVLCDARDLPTADMVEDVRTLVRQRDDARDDAQRLRDLRAVRDHDWDLLTARAEQAERERDEAREERDVLALAVCVAREEAVTTEARVAELEARLVELAACDDHGEDRLRLMAVRDAAEAVCNDSQGVDAICEGVLKRHMKTLRAALAASKGGG